MRILFLALFALSLKAYEYPEESCCERVSLAANKNICCNKIDKKSHTECSFCSSAEGENSHLRYSMFSVVKGDQSQVKYSCCADVYGNHSKAQCACCADVLGEHSRTHCFCNSVQANDYKNIACCITAYNQETYPWFVDLNEPINQKPKRERMIE